MGRAMHLGFALSLGSTAVAADDVCNALANRMAPDTLYIVSCTTDASCLYRLNEGSRPILPRGARAQFAFKTNATSVQNSIVVVQLKHVGLQPRTTPQAQDVALTRQELRFACSRGQRELVREAIPGPDEPERTVGYDVYDHFHRYDFTTPPEEGRRLRNHFHLRYFNGERCEATFDDLRRPQFLIHDRAKVPDRFTRTAYRYGLTTGVAVAQVPLKYERLRVHMANYMKKPQAEGCFSFTAQVQGSQLDIGLSDLEEKVRGPANERHLLREWSILVGP